MATTALDRRKPLVFGVSVVGALVLFSSVAFACVQTRGMLTVTGSNGRTSTAVGNGHHPFATDNPNNIYCMPGKYLTAGATSFRGGTGTPATASFSVKLGLPPDDCKFLKPNDRSPWIPDATTPNVFPNGVYEVNFCQGPSGQAVFTGPPIKLTSGSSTDPHGSCFFSDGVTDWGVKVGTVRVADHVSDPTTFGVPFGAFATPAGTYAGVAVRLLRPGCECGPPPVNLAPIALI